MFVSTGIREDMIWVIVQASRVSLAKQERLVMYEVMTGVATQSDFCVFIFKKFSL